MSDLFGNHIVGFPTRRLIFVAACPDISCSNNGTLEQDTCQCDCVHGFTGLFCQTRRFAYNCGLGCTASNLLRNNVVFSRNSILLYTAR